MNLTNWSTSIPRPYAAPEVQGLPCVAGILGESHRHFSKGHHVTTSAVVKINGRMIVTRSGSTYNLVGDPDPRWVEEMKRKSVEVDLDNPLKDWKP